VEKVAVFWLLRLDQVHFALGRQVEQLRPMKVFQLLVSVLELLVELDALFRHLLVGAVTAADNLEVLAARGTDVAIVVVQPDPQQHGLLLGPGYQHSQLP